MCSEKLLLSTFNPGLKDPVCIPVFFQCGKAVFRVKFILIAPLLIIEFVIKFTNRIIFLNLLRNAPFTLSRSNIFNGRHFVFNHRVVLNFPYLCVSNLKACANFHVDTRIFNPVSDGNKT